MNEKEIKAILDKLDLENNDEYDLTRFELDTIIDRNKTELNKLLLQEFVFNVIEDAYKLGFAKGLLIAGVDIPPGENE